MVILHISAISGEKSSGMSVVVPEHVKNQSNLAETAMFNCMDYVPENAKDAYKVFLSKNYKEFDISKLEKTFSKPDLVVFHGIYILYYIKIYKNLKKYDIPYIILPHGSLTKKAQKKKRLKKIIGNKLFFDNFIKNANYIQYLSEMEKKESSQYKKQSIVLGNGIYVPDNKLKVNFDIEELKFVYIGRLDIYHKGLDILLEAIKIVKDEIKERNIIFNIYGPFNGQEQKMKQFIKKYDLDNIAKIHNGIYTEEKRNVLLASDIFIQTSRSEGQPLGIMEAMSYGLPCIVTEGTSFAEIVNNNKCGYSSTNNANEISKNILKIIRNTEEIYEFSNNAYKYASNNFSWKMIAKMTIEKYKEIKRNL